MRRQGTYVAPVFILTGKKVFMSDDIIDRDTHDHDMTYENEQSMVTIPLREYDKLKEQGQYITDASLISVIDKIEELVRALRKHIVRKF